MGTATSKNVASAVAYALTQISTEISANSIAQNVCGIVFRAKNCSIQGDVKINAMCNTYSVTDQIVSMNGSATLNSIIGQNLVQTATSKVGTFGLGIVDSINIEYEFVNSIKDIVSISGSGSVQIQNQFQSFYCENREIYGNINLELLSSADFLAQQAQLMDEINKITNKVTQSIAQKATAVVEGATGYIVVFAAIALAIAYAVQKGISTLAIPLLAIFTIGIMLLLWWVKAPPIFNVLEMYPSGNFWSGYFGCDSNVASPSKQSINIDSPPLRYIFPIMSSSNRVGLFDMTASVLYPQIPNQKTSYYDILNQYKNAVTSISTIYPDFYTFLTTNPILVQSGINTDYWKNTFLPKANVEQLALARSVLMFIISNGGLSGSEMHNLGFVLDSSLTGGKEYYPSQCDNLLAFTPSGTNPQDVRDLLLNGTDKGGTLSGNFGYCLDNTYRIQNFLHNQYGWYVISGVFSIILIVLWILSKYKAQ